jgi:hypothetical protein
LRFNGSAEARAKPESVSGVVVAGLPGELLAKRNDAISRIASLAAEMEREIGSVKAIDSVLSMFDPDHARWNGSGLSPAPEADANEADSFEPQQPLADSAGDFFGSDERTAVVKSILRKSRKAMTSGEIADAYEKRKGVTLDKAAKSRVVSRVSAILARLRNQGLVAHMDNEERRRSWRLTQR